MGAAQSPRYNPHGCHKDASFNNPVCGGSTHLQAERNVPVFGCVSVVPPPHPPQRSLVSTRRRRQHAKTFLVDGLGSVKTCLEDLPRSRLRSSVRLSLLESDAKMWRGVYGLVLNVCLRQKRHVKISRKGEDVTITAKSRAPRGV